MTQKIKVLATSIFLTFAWIGAAMAAEADMWCLQNYGPPLQWQP